MKKLLFLALILLIGCKNESKKPSDKKKEITNVVNENYELVKANNSKALLIIFPGGGSTSKETKRDFKIIDKATEKGITVLLMNFGRKLWIENEDSQELSKLIIKAVEENNLSTNNVFIGGMSIGGTVALTLSDYLHKTNSALKPKGVFIVDSPIDLFALYESSQKDVLRKNFSEERLAEPKWIINYFEEEFGGKNSLLTNIQKVSPLTITTKNVNNIKNLKNEKLRFYTEPDTLWWKENRQTDFESTNAYTIQKTKELLTDNNWDYVELIQTKDKGFQNDGERNPHSWSIVDIDDLINWVLE
ncbi:alpha/beta hydrolase [Polaribacter sp. Hel1_85]|uniref:alpha/beta hydrolase n=1 Tax=Polaribacter sp. Hel1_85 TaxID=1250005 RepID=UPI00052E1A28|nr:alpha/beta hydrolase [Polaribacter sp. Hel1_85]KGL63502.1 alpha/beta hydrolase family protein [Polaribacter sp. Hel1_85]